MLEVIQEIVDQPATGGDVEPDGDGDPAEAAVAVEVLSHQGQVDLAQGQGADGESQQDVRNQIRQIEGSPASLAGKRLGAKEGPTGDVGDKEEGSEAGGRQHGELVPLHVLAANEPPAKQQADAAENDASGAGESELFLGHGAESYQPGSRGLRRDYIW